MDGYGSSASILVELYWSVANLASTTATLQMEIIWNTSTY